MKTATVTWISYKNYGTYLQAYALQQAILSLGFENTILDDTGIMDEYFQAIRKDTSVLQNDKPAPMLKRAYGLFARFANRILRTEAYLKSLSNEKANNICQKVESTTSDFFDNFRHEKMFVSEYITRNDFPEINNSYDAFICGSDQIWALPSWEVRDYYYLAFVDSEKIKVSYAPSMNFYNIPDSKGNDIQNWLSSYNALSLREDNPVMQKLCDNRFVTVCDPTLLLTAESWKKISEPPKIDTKYILCYFLECSNWYYDYAKQVSKELNLPIYIIPNNIYWYELSDTYTNGVGPSEFVGLIENAEYVITDSYHGTLFSLLFNIPFITFRRFEDNGEFDRNNRLANIFKVLDIDYSLIVEKSFDKKDICMQFADLKDNMEQFRAKSYNYLNRGLSNEC